MAVRNPKDLWTGVIYIAFGVAALILGRDYGMGTARKMGPAFFPAILSTILIVIGIISVARSFTRAGTPIGSVTFKGLAFVAGATIVFGLLVRGAGLVVAMPVLVVGSAYASQKFNLRTSVLMALGLTVFCIVVFLKGLGIPMPVLGTWFGQ